MNKTFEKILEMLEELQNYACFPTEWVNEEQSKIHSYYANKLTEILKLTEQYSNGWIPCSERLPEVDGNTSDTVLVCGSNGFQYMAFWCDDLQWRFCECGMAKEPVLWTEIVAWQPLPEPFKEV